MTTIAEHKLNVIRQVDELTEESLIEVEKLIAQLKKNQAIKVLKKRCQPPESIANKAKIVGDIISPCVNVNVWMGIEEWRETAQFDEIDAELTDEMITSWRDKSGGRDFLWSN